MVVPPSGNVTITPADLINATHPDARYETLRFTGGADEVPARIILPVPATLDDAYTIRFENVSSNAVIAAIDPTLLATFTLVQFQGTESSLEGEIQDAAEESATYRTDVLVTPEGAFRVPGFYIND